MNKVKLNYEVAGPVFGKFMPAIEQYTEDNQLEIARKILGLEYEWTADIKDERVALHPNYFIIEESDIDGLMETLGIHFPETKEEAEKIVRDTYLYAEIKRLKKEKNAIILAHYYQEPAIQDVADFIGDSLALAKKAEHTDASMIVFAGVHFMAETAKILNPDKKVVIPDMKAGCSLADSCPPDKFAEFKAKHPDHVVISYINCTAEIKAMSDIICTSSNAEAVVNSVPLDQKIIFAPDWNLGRYIAKKTGRPMELWYGTCMVHEIFSLKKLTALKEQYPNAKVIAHPECTTSVLEAADFIGSTAAMLSYTETDPAKEFIVVTEPGIIHEMLKRSPNKSFIPAPPTNNCACNECPHMKLNTLEKLYLCLRDEKPEIVMSKEMIEKSYKPLKRMLEIK